MKICFYTTGDIREIATMKRALGMAGPLMKLGWEVSIIAEDSPTNRSRIAIEAPGADVRYFPRSGAWSEIRRKRALLRAVAPDVVWVCALTVRNFVSGTRARVLVEHSELASAIRSWSWDKRLIVKFLENYSTRYSGLVCASRYLERYYAAKTRKPIFYSPYAYNEDVIRMPLTIQERLQREKGASYAFLYLGSMEREYGLFTMLEAMKILAQRGKDIKLYLVGEGGGCTAATDFIRANGLEEQIIQTGYAREEELNDYFTMADAFISPLNDTVQDWARCPSKVYMYLPYNKPVLTNRIGEPLEIFGERGLYFDTSDPQSLADLMERTASLRQGNVDAAEHSWTARAEAFDAWYRTNF